MALEKVLVMSRARVIVLAQFIVLLSAAVFAPLVHNQIITGSIVNATLFVSAALLGLEGAILIGLLPSLFALTAGTLPMALAPLIPFIMLSNILLVLVFSSLGKADYWLKMVSAAVLKFIFLSAVSYWVVNLLLPGKIAGAAAAMLNWPQLITALLGGFLAYAVLRSGQFISNK